ncbi:MAG: 6-bladed beta-propeller [Rikenellaceae bacterium]
MKKLATLILSLAFFSCQETNTVVATLVDGLIMINTGDVKDTIDVPLSEFVEDLEIIELDPAIEAYVNPFNKPIISDNYLILSDNNSQCKLFDRKTGKFITKIGARGNGPGEYSHHIDYGVISEKHNSIYLTSYYARNIIEYDLEGNFKRNIPIHSDRIHRHTKFVVDEEKGIITIFAIPYNALVWQQDFEGNALNEYIKIETNNAMLSSTTLSTLNNSFNISTVKCCNKQDTLYSYDRENHVLKPIFTTKIDGFSEGKTIADTKTLAYYTETPKYFMARVLDIDYSVDGNGVQSVSGEKAFDLAVNKNTLSANFVNIYNDFLIDMTTYSISIYGDYFTTAQEAISLLEKLEKFNEEKRADADPKMLERVDKLLETLNEESNTVVFIGKLK